MPLFARIMFVVLVVLTLAPAARATTSNAQAACSAALWLQNLGSDFGYTHLHTNGDHVPPGGTMPSCPTGQCVFPGSDQSFPCPGLGENDAVTIWECMPCPWKRGKKQLFRVLEFF